MDILKNNLDPRKKEYYEQILNCVVMRENGMMACPEHKNKPLHVTVETIWQALEEGYKKKTRL